MGCRARSVRKVQLYREGVKLLTDRLVAGSCASCLLLMSGRRWRSRVSTCRRGRCSAGQAARWSRGQAVQGSVGREVREDGRWRATGRRHGRSQPLHAYVVLLLTAGLRPEEVRALRWDHVDLDAWTVAV